MPKINATSLGKKTNATFKNSVKLMNFSVKLTDLALTFFPRENLLIAKNQCHFPREKSQCQNRFHGKKSVCTKKFSPLVYLVNHVEITCARIVVVFTKNFSNKRNFVKVQTFQSLEIKITLKHLYLPSHFYLQITNMIN